MGLGAVAAPIVPSNRDESDEEEEAPEEPNEAPKPMPEEKDPLPPPPLPPFVDLDCALSAAASFACASFNACLRRFFSRSLSLSLSNRSRSFSSLSRSFSAFSRSFSIRSRSFSAFSRSFSAFSRSFSARSRSTFVFFSDSELSRRRCFFTRFPLLLLLVEASFDEESVEVEDEEAVDDDDDDDDDVVVVFVAEADDGCTPHATLDELSSTSEDGFVVVMSSPPTSSLEVLCTLFLEGTSRLLRSESAPEESSRWISPDMVNRLVLSSSEVITSSGDRTTIVVEKETALGDEGEDRSGSITISVVVEVEGAMMAVDVAVEVNVAVVVDSVAFIPLTEPEEEEEVSLAEPVSVALPVSGTPPDAAASDVDDVVDIGTGAAGIGSAT